MPRCTANSATRTDSGVLSRPAPERRPRGGRPPSDPIHRAISKLSSGDTINVRLNADPWQLTDQNGNTVGRLARSFTPPDSMTCISATVAAVINWSRENSTPEFRGRIRSDTWEVVIPELTLLRVKDSNDQRRGV